jgi:hypothetical protein
MKNRTTSTTISAIAACLGVVALSASAVSQDRPVPDTYLAVTQNMDPADVELKADVLRWSTDEERQAVIAALQSEEDPAAALRELPTVGVVWRSGSAVGHSIKYSHRAETADGRSRVTLVTDKTIGATSFVPWKADHPVTDAALDYSVVEMTVGNGDDGQGTMSLSANVTIDPESATVSLDPGGGAPLLTNARLAPKPYWAKQ